jgi:hypothetical protein
LRRSGKFLIGLLVVLSVATLKFEASASVAFASVCGALGEPLQESAVEALVSRECFLKTPAAENVPGEAQQTAFGLEAIPVLGECFLFLPKVFAGKRPLQERNVEFVVWGQNFFSAAKALSGVFSDLKTTSLIIRRFSTHIAVRK